MKQGDLILLKNENPPKAWIILKVTSHKKPWHRKFTIMDHKGRIDISWKFKDRFIILQ